jgi:glycosyltransferase involved in cell wall biosynthesis
MKIAKILLGDPANQKGFFNSVMERTKHLMEAESDVDCYMIRLEYGFVLRLLKRQFRKSQREEFSTIQGIKFKNLWITMGLLDYLLTYRLHRRAILDSKQLNNYVPLFKDYDLLSTHGIDAIFLSARVKKEFNIPFVTTWHGSDINVMPFRSNSIKNEVKQLLDSADHNFFVSQKLLETSEKISIEAKKSVLYTGPAKSFYPYDEEDKKALREKYNVNTKYVVGFIGNFVSIKNVLVLPALFKKIQEEVQDVSFVIVGNGELGNLLESKLIEQSINNLHILGKLNPEEIPDIMNFLDLLVLPSLNEGFPLVTLEAQACGVHVVGSNRGGIPESIGEENCFELDDDFVERATFRVIELLKNKIEQPVLSKDFSWDNVIEKELLVHNSVVF